MRLIRPKRRELWRGSQIDFDCKVWQPVFQTRLFGEVRALGGFAVSIRTAPVSIVADGSDAVTVQWSRG